jgi:hypothetical protein
MTELQRRFYAGIIHVACTQFNQNHLETLRSVGPKQTGGIGQGTRQGGNLDSGVVQFWPDFLKTR